MHCNLENAFRHFFHYLQRKRYGRCALAKSHVALICRHGITVGMNAMWMHPNSRGIHWALKTEQKCLCDLPTTNEELFISELSSFLPMNGWFIIVWIDLRFASEACDNCGARDSMLSKIQNTSAANWNIRRKWIIQISFLLFTCIITPVFITKNYEMFAEMHLPFSSRVQISENRRYVFRGAYIWIN